MTVQALGVRQSLAGIAALAVSMISLCGCSSHPEPAASIAAPAAVATVSRAAEPVALAQQVVVLDPGHNGGNSANPQAIGHLVPDGRGGTKQCNTTGTSTDAGYSEHAFNWDVANRVRDELQAHGVQVVMTRNDDNSVGPCVDERAAIGNRSAAAAVVSIHADGAGPTDYGFHVSYSSPPLNAAQGDPSIKSAQALRNAMTAAGFPEADYIGHDGLYARSDLAGLNLSRRPAALIECGNMRDAADAATLSSAAGRQRYADAITAGILDYLGL